MREILTVNVTIKEIIEMENQDAIVKMILFDGESHCDIFNGMVLNGGVDTQVIEKSGKSRISARYLLEGQDASGEKCRIFIENNGTINEDGKIETVPVIMTDSKRIKWIEKEIVYGDVVPDENGIKIRFMG